MKTGFTIRKCEAYTDRNLLHLFAFFVFLRCKLTIDKWQRNKTASCCTITLGNAGGLLRGTPGGGNENVLLTTSWLTWVLLKTCLLSKTAICRNARFREGNDYFLAVVVCSRITECVLKSRHYAFGFTVNAALPLCRTQTT